MTEGVQNLINAIAEGDSVGIESAFNQEMATRISDRLDDMRIEVARNMFRTEEVDLDEEQLDELSKKTLGNYITKAAGDAVLNTVSAHYDKSGYHADKSRQRRAGIRQAVSKLTKEEVEEDASEE
jgi:hypothetical protein